MGVRKGAPWGRPTGGPPDVVVAGDDRALARAVADHEAGVRLRWDPDPAADFARVVGIGGPATATTGSVDLPCDALLVTTSTGDVPLPRVLAVNMVVVGTAPDRQRRLTRSPSVHVVVDGRTVHDGATLGVVIGNGQFLRGADVVPRGHPGDGRAEVQVYTVPAADRAAMRRRLTQGTHVPHPGVLQVSGRRVELEMPRRLPLEIDGHDVPPVGSLVVDVQPTAFVLVT